MFVSFSIHVIHLVSFHFLLFIIIPFFSFLFHPHPCPYDNIGLPRVFPSLLAFISFLSSYFPSFSSFHSHPCPYYNICFPQGFSSLLPYTNNITTLHSSSSNSFTSSLSVHIPRLHTVPPSHTLSQPGNKNRRVDRSCQPH